MQRAVSLAKIGEDTFLLCDDAFLLDDRLCFRDRRKLQQIFRRRVAQLLSLGRVCLELHPLRLRRGEFCVQLL